MEDKEKGGSWSTWASGMFEAPSGVEDLFCAAGMSGSLFDLLGQDYAREPTPEGETGRRRPSGVEEDPDGHVKEVKFKEEGKGRKRQREPRYAFVTKSEVEQLDDGFRWRKYGQKAVKNSPFPRSYFRCTAAACPVKKRVERCSRDPALVVTTYEAHHTHPCPAPARPRGGTLQDMLHQPLASGNTLTSYTKPKRKP